MDTSTPPAATPDLEHTATAAPSLDTSVTPTSDDHPLAAGELAMLLSVSDTPSRRNTRGMTAATAPKATVPPNLDGSGSREKSHEPQQQGQGHKYHSHGNISLPSPHLVALALLAASAKSFEEDMHPEQDEGMEEQDRAAGGDGNFRRGHADEHTPHPKRIRVRASTGVVNAKQCKLACVGDVPVPWVPCVLGA